MTIPPRIGTDKFSGPVFNTQINNDQNHSGKPSDNLPEILFITSYPPRECGIATYSQDLISALKNKFNSSFKLSICALESGHEKYDYPVGTDFRLNTDDTYEFCNTSEEINKNTAIKLIVIQHEFGFYHKNEAEFITFMNALNKPLITVFHTVLPHPEPALKIHMLDIAAASVAIIVMTQTSKSILIEEYGIDQGKITVIPHGTHLLEHTDQKTLKTKYNLQGRKILSTFGLLSSGKNIETTLQALPEIIKSYPDVLFLIIGKTHPTVFKHHGDRYINHLKFIIAESGLSYHVRFINRYLPLDELLEYLQLTDIYLFTSNDPHQAVSGTFSYAISAGCPVISTPIPHAKEIVGNDTGIIIDFGNADQLTKSVCTLLSDDKLRNKISSNALHKMASTAWENSAIAHARLFKEVCGNEIQLYYALPPLNLDHFKKLTDNFGMMQFSKINQPDPESGYTLDDNARALIAICQHYEVTEDPSDLLYLHIYFTFIGRCQQNDGSFLNYIGKEKNFTSQNRSSDLSDANGRAIWALGYLISMTSLLPKGFTPLCLEAESIFRKALIKVSSVHSTRAMSFTIKGLYYRNSRNKSVENLSLMQELADRLIQMYRHESDTEWHWFESYLTYANSVIPEALLCAWFSTGEEHYKDVARTSFDFLLSKTFTENHMKLISNKKWLHKAHDTYALTSGGEQPIDVAYTILALQKFYEVFREERYKKDMETAFNWFLGNNTLHQIIYNPCTGGCYDGLETHSVNLNQGAESTISYLLSRLTVTRYLKTITVDENKWGGKQKKETEIPLEKIGAIK